MSDTKKLPALRLSHAAARRIAGLVAQYDEPIKSPGCRPRKVEAPPDLVAFRDQLVELHDRLSDIAVLLRDARDQLGDAHAVSPQLDRAIELLGPRLGDVIA